MQKYNLVYFYLVTLLFVKNKHFLIFFVFLILLMVRFSARGSCFGNNNKQEQILVGVRCTNANQATVLKEKRIKINKLETIIKR